MSSSKKPIVALHKACLTYGNRLIWNDLNLEISPGEFVAVLGPNGSGKTSFLKVLLGLEKLASGSILVEGKIPKRGNVTIGYIPQQKGFDPDLPVRGIDLVGFGLSGHRYGFAKAPNEAAAIEEVIAEVGATSFASKPIGKMSGGEQQRLRVAQALLGDPQLLLCDEPLLSLDLSQQQVVSNLIDTRRRTHNTAVVFVTHDINPILNTVDKVLYLVNGRWVIGAPHEVLTSETLTELYGSPVDVLHIKGRIIVMGAGEALHTEPTTHHHVHHTETSHHHHG